MSQTSKMPSAVFPDLKGKSIFISGGGAGIGATLTESFLAQGAHVTFIQRSDATDFCDEMEAKYHERPHFIKCDILDIPALESALDQAKEKHGPIHVLVNNAASDNRHKLETTDIEDFDKGINVNLRPHFFTAKHVAKDMAALGGGSIINFSSIAHHLGGDQFPVYVAAKAGIAGLTRALADTLGKDNIRVNSVLPGWVFTKRQLDLWATEEKVAEHLKTQSIPEKLYAEDMVGIVLFLASDASRMLTRQSIAVDGGVVGLG
jgi:NAD(P)-dependent dehydrogenase (short-subunit alcohol dehydrogenase family)